MGDIGHLRDIDLIRPDPTIKGEDKHVGATDGNFGYIFLECDGNAVGYIKRICRVVVLTTCPGMHGAIKSQYHAIGAQRNLIVLGRVSAGDITEQ